MFTSCMKEVFGLKKKLFIRNGILLAGTALVIRSIGMVLRVFLNGVVGTEGMGLYQLIMSVYGVFAAVSFSGIFLCATRLTAGYMACGHTGQALYAARYCFALAAVVGLCMGTILWVGAEPIACFLLHQPKAAPSLRLLSVSLPFVSASACMQGYFLARRRVLPSSVEQLLEQLLSVGGLLLLFQLYPPRNTAQACAFTAGTAAVAQALSALFFWLCYRVDIKHLKSAPQPVKRLYRQIAPIWLPVTANACLRSGLSAAENALIPLSLQRFGYTEKDALSQYGIISGMSMMVLVFPSVAVLPFASLIVSEVEEARVQHSPNTVRHLCEIMLTRCLQYALPVMVLLWFYAKPLCLLLFGHDEAGRYLALLAPVVPFMYLDAVVDALLKGLNRQTSYFVFNTIDSAVRVLLTVILIPLMGVHGVILVIIVSELLNTFLSLWRLLSITHLQISLRRHLLFPIAVILVPCLFLRLLPSAPSNAIWLIGHLLLCSLFYFGTLVCFRKV